MEDFPELKDGDTMEPWHYNILARDANRWRKITVVPPLSIEGADGDTPVISLTDPPSFFIQLTGVYASGYPWKQVHIGAGRVITDAFATGSTATGRPAFEIQTGDTTLTADGTVYEARVSPASNQVVFDGKN